MEEEQYKYFAPISYFGFFIIFLAFVFSTTYYIANEYIASVPDQNSLNKIYQLQNILYSLFGSNWYIILISISIFLILLLVLLYVISIQGININVSDDHYKMFFILFLILVTVISGSIITIAVREIINSQSTCVNTSTLTNYDSLNSYTKNQELIQIIGLSLFILISVVIGIWYIIKWRKNPQEPKVETKPVQPVKQAETKSDQSIPNIETKSVQQEPKVDVKSTQKGSKKTKRATKVKSKGAKQAPKVEVKPVEPVTKVDVKPVQQAPKVEVKPVQQVPKVEVKPVQQVPKVEKLLRPKNLK